MNSASVWQTHEPTVMHAHGDAPERHCTKMWGIPITSKNQSRKRD